MAVLRSGIAVAAPVGYASSVAQCPSAAELRLEHVAIAAELITIMAAGRRTTVPCAVCGTPATGVRSRYVRTLAVLPWRGVSA